MTEEDFRRKYYFHIEFDVQWIDMDAFQHVNNKEYFRYFEKIRIDYFEERGFMANMEENAVGPIVSSTQCRFKFPLKYPDRIIIGVYISDLETDRFLMNYGIFSLKHQRVAAVGDAQVVCFDYRVNKKAPLPGAICARLREEMQDNAT